MSALLSSWAEEKEYKIGHNEKKEWKSILTNTVWGYMNAELCLTESGKSPAGLRISALT